MDFIYFWSKIDFCLCQTFFSWSILCQTFFLVKILCQILETVKFTSGFYLIVGYPFRVWTHV